MAHDSVSEIHLIMGTTLVLNSLSDQNYISMDVCVEDLYVHIKHIL